MRYDFYAYMERMKYIKRWQLMRSVREENIMEHSQSVALFSHALVTIHNEVFGGKADVLKTVLYAMYHETAEVMTGDLPTPIKYYNRSIQGAYKELERNAAEKIVNTLPEAIRGEIAPFVLADEDSAEYRLVKAADRLAAYIKCLSETKLGNTEFKRAMAQTKQRLDDMKMPEIDYFMEHFVPSFSLSLHELENTDE